MTLPVHPLALLLPSICPVAHATTGYAADALGVAEHKPKLADEGAQDPRVHRVVHGLKSFHDAVCRELRLRLAQQRVVDLCDRRPNPRHAILSEKAGLCDVVTHELVELPGVLVQLGHRHDATPLLNGVSECPACFDCLPDFVQPGRGLHHRGVPSGVAS